MVEIACALGAEARIFIMDEPTAALGTREVEALFMPRVVAWARSGHRMADLLTGWKVTAASASPIA